MHELTPEQRRLGKKIDTDNEQSRWANLYRPGTDEYKKTKEFLTKTSFGTFKLNETQIRLVLNALGTGEFQNNIPAAFDHVMRESQNQKNTHR